MEQTRPRRLRLCRPGEQPPAPPADELRITEVPPQLLHDLEHLAAFRRTTVRAIALEHLAMAVGKLPADYQPHVTPRK